MGHVMVLDCARQWTLTQQHAAALSRSYLAQRAVELAVKRNASKAVVSYLGWRAHLAVLAENDLGFRLMRYTE